MKWSGDIYEHIRKIQGALAKIQVFRRLAVAYAFAHGHAPWRLFVVLSI